MSQNPHMRFDDQAFNDENSNDSDNRSFEQILRERVSRRDVLKTGAALGTVTAGAMMFGYSPQVHAKNDNPTQAAKQLNFKAVDKNTLDTVSVPAGYTASIIYALGDPLKADVPAYRNDGSDTQFEHRAGDHHDGMEWFGLDDAGRPSRTATTRGLLGMNHEATTNEKLSSHFIHSDGGVNTLPRPEQESDKEIALHGVSFVEVRQANGQWRYEQNSPFNARLTPNTPIALSGPAAGNALMKTKFDVSGKRARGTLNNCGTGKTPWNTLLTGEENWAGYFFRSANDDAARNDQSVVALNRYGRKQGEASRHGWESSGTQDRFARWNNSQIGTSKDGSDDYRNEMNTFGYMVEIDPYSATKRAKKRTALGRFAHESASFNLLKPRQPLHIYMGDDARNEYIYKFVSAELWDPADANSANPLAVGDKYLDRGTLYAAKFNADGTGQWLELSMNNPAIKNYKGYTFKDLGDICINARLAADAVGATKMDRPEWNGSHPVTGEVYFTLTNNSKRSVNPKKGEVAPDAANPRVYTDMKNGKAQDGNPNGHILRLRDYLTRGKTNFAWDIYLFGAEALADASTINLSRLTDDQDFSSPDGIAFSPSTGICWIQTDDSAYTDQTNCMMLAAIPGRVGDGPTIQLNYINAEGQAVPVTTPVGKAPSSTELKRFLVGPKDCEITGLCETPDGKAIFVNIQHPGENTPLANIGAPEQYTSHWPANAGYGAGKRPRSATIVITKDDGGVIGS